MIDDQGPALNPVFDKLVQSNDDVEGLLAYAYYKRHKRSWLLEFRKNRSRSPDRGEERVFADGACVGDQLVRYRQEAQNPLIAYANVYVAGARQEIEREAITMRMERAADRIERQGGVWRQVETSLYSSVITTAVLIVLAVGIRLFGIDLIDAVSQLSGGS